MTPVKQECDICKFQVSCASLILKNEECGWMGEFGLVTPYSTLLDMVWDDTHQRLTWHTYLAKRLHHTIFEDNAKLGAWTLWAMKKYRFPNSVHRSSFAYLVCMCVCVQPDIYSQVPLYRGLIYPDNTYDTAITMAENESNFRITTGAPYLALTGELWGVYCEDLEENWNDHV